MLSMNTSSEKGGTRFLGAKMTSSLQTSLGFRVMLWNGIKVMTWARRQRDSAEEDGALRPPFREVWPLFWEVSLLGCSSPGGRSLSCCLLPAVSSLTSY